MVREWQLNLENMGGKKGLKDPVGYYKDTPQAVTVRTGKDSATTTQLEVVERVSDANDLRFGLTGGMIVRKRGSSRSHRLAKCPCSSS